jgi:hypothetical protein
MEMDDLPVAPAHCIGTVGTMRQLPRSFESLVSLRQKVCLFGLHITSGR